jgi:hypothetical protein
VGIDDLLRDGRLVEASGEDMAVEEARALQVVELVVVNVLNLKGQVL